MSIESAEINHAALEALRQRKETVRRLEAVLAQILQGLDTPALRAGAGQSVEHVR